MHKYGRIDENQPEIVAALRKIGCSVEILSSVGGGCPDLLVGLDYKNYLMEVKPGFKPPSERRLTAEEKKFHGTWRGQVNVVNNIHEAFKVIGKKELGIMFNELNTGR